MLGVVDIVKEAYTDHTQFDKKDPHYDPKSSKVSHNFWIFRYKVNYINFLLKYRLNSISIEKAYLGTLNAS